MFLNDRHLVPEWMDADDVDPRELGRALRFIRRINSLLGYNANLVRRIAAELNRIGDRPSTVLDVAAGSGDLLAELSRWAHQNGRAINVVGLDRHASTVEQGAAGDATDAGVQFLRADALALPFADASVDVVVSTLFIHHLPEEVAVAALAEMRRVAKHTVIVADLIRSKRAYFWIVLFTLWTSRMIKHDARASVAHAFTIEEARRLADRAGMTGATVEESFGHRFVLRWEREIIE